MNVETKCQCQHCGGYIVYASEAAGQAVSCPHCGKETPVDSAHNQSRKFFVWQEEQQQGPFDHEVIQEMLASGQITDETLLCPEEGDLSWTPARELSLEGSRPETPPARAETNESSEGAVESMAEIKINKFHSFFYQPTENEENVSVEIKMQSGGELKIKAVRLFDESILLAIAAKRAEAAQGSKGVSTGLGSIGSLEWVLASSLVIGAVEGVLSAATNKAGTSSLAEALRLEQLLRKQDLLIPVGIIQNIEHPVPGLWRAVGEMRFQIPDREPSSNKSALIHDGGDFLAVQTDDGALRSIRWSSVEAYFFNKYNMLG